MRQPIVINGISTDIYSANTINVPSIKDFVAVLRNTGVNDLNLKIISKINTLEYEELGETLLTAGSQLRYFEKDYTYTIIFYIESTIAGNPTSYTIEYIWY